MSSKIAVIAIHGIGTPKPEFAEPLIRSVSNQLVSRGNNPLDVVWKPIIWSSSLSTNEATLLRTMNTARILRWSSLRRFVMLGLADAVAYQYVERDKAALSVYESVHQTIANEIHSLNLQLSGEDLGTTRSVPMVIVAHSLGCHVMSNYIWDCQRKRRFPIDDNPFEWMENIVGIHTMGCNIPLYSLASVPFLPISFRHRKPQDTNIEKIRAKSCVWNNYLSPFDILGYPLKPLGREYDVEVSEDINVRIGTIFRRYTPFCHSEYWRSCKISRQVARNLLEIREAINEVDSTQCTATRVC